MNLDPLTPLFTDIQNIFRKTMKELFVNECLCEKASLYFFVIEIFDCSKCVYFVDEQLTIEVVKNQEKQVYDEVIGEFLANTFSDRRYLIEESDDVSIDGHKVKILWAFFSECLDGNSGRFMLQCAFEELAADFNKRLKSIEGICDVRTIAEIIAEKSGESHYLMQRIIQGAAARTCLYIHKLYAPLNLPFVIELSGEYYEKSECRSNMVFLFQQTVNKIKKTDFLYCLDNIKFDDMKIEEIEFVPSQIRLIRKLLQIAQQDLCLVLGENANKKTFKVLGICKESFFQERDKEFPYIMIKYRNHMQWDMMENQSYIFTYRNGQYKIERKINEEYLIRKISEYFGGQEIEYRSLSANIMNAIQQEHGTMIIIMNEVDANQEIGRLGGLRYGLPSALPRICTEEVKCLSNIDGSIIIDTSGKIHGIGMILDGVARVSGNLARGARYNSAVKYREYLETNGIKAMILIISEDGMIDIM